MIFKGIQHTVKYMKKLFHGYKTRKDAVPAKSHYLMTTCHFHVGGFVSPMNIMYGIITYIYNHGPDLLDGLETTELLYKEIGEYFGTGISTVKMATKFDFFFHLL